jgi:hypothetical protein
MVSQIVIGPGRVILRRRVVWARATTGFRLVDAPLQPHRRHDGRDHRCVAIVADAHRHLMGEVDAVDEFEEAVDEVLARLLAVGDHCQPGVLLQLHDQDGRVTLRLRELVACQAPGRHSLFGSASQAGLGSEPTMVAGEEGGHGEACAMTAGNCRLAQRLPRASSAARLRMSASRVCSSWLPSIASWIERAHTPACLIEHGERRRAGLVLALGGLLGPAARTALGPRARLGDALADPRHLLQDGVGRLAVVLEVRASGVGDRIDALVAVGGGARVAGLFEVGQRRVNDARRRASRRRSIFPRAP